MDKIQEITSKLYNEGVEKGNQEAERIIAEAKEKEARMLAEANEKAAHITATAHKQAAELKAHTESELKLYAAQSSEALKTQIVNLITGEIATRNVKTAMEDTAFMQQLITKMIESWAKNENLTVGVENGEALKDFVTKNAKQLMDKGLKIESVNGIGTGFTVMPEDGSYKVKFGENEFIEYFKEFLRPQVQQLLF